jgi:mono/diheme cytochrome c family protein
MSTALTLCLLVAPSAPIDLEPGDLKSGLVAEYHSVADAETRITQIEAKPAFTLGRSSPHPRIPPGPFEVTWSGVLQIKESGAITFSALVGGELTVTVDGVTVLDGRGLTDTAQLKGKAPLRREPGYYKFVAKYRSLADVPARLQLWWEGEQFAREPLPAWRLGHLDAEEAQAVQLDRVRAGGREIVRDYGCARCHAGALPAITTPPPGPSLADTGRRLGKPWLMEWLADPAKVRADAHMPGVFAPNRDGFVERWIVTEALTAGAGKHADDGPQGDHRRGRLAFLSIGCATCHFIPDSDPKEQKQLGQRGFTGLADRMSATEIATFLGNPRSRYPDGRMPHLPVTPAEARDIAAYLLLWSKPSERVAVEAPKPQELQVTFKRLGTRDQATTAAILLREKGCTACHTGLGESRALDVPIKPGAGAHCTGVASPAPSIGYRMYREVAAQERYPSPFADRQHRLARAGCAKCHQRDTDRPAPIEEIGSTLGGAFLQEVPFLRTPRLTNAHQKYTRAHLGSSVREGVSGLRGARFTYRMPAFGAEADVLLQALAEADGELFTESDPPEPVVADPVLGTLDGSRLVGFQGYSCASCHVWNGKLIGSPDPAATGPDLTHTAGRIRRDWFDRYLESPMRFHPGTPMPGVFPHGKPATLTTVLDGDPVKQKDALWAYLVKGKDAPSPAPPPPVPVAPPAAGEEVLVAQIPIRLPDGKVVESICVLSAAHDLVVYDLNECSPVALFTGGQILRNVQGRIRQFIASGSAVDSAPLSAWDALKRAKPTERTLLGYDRLPDGVRLRWQFHLAKETVDVEDALRFVSEKGTRGLVRELKLASDAKPVVVRTPLPAAKVPPAWENKPLNFPDDPEGSLERPGYKAVMYPRPKTISGEDRVMPGAIAVRPRDGKVFVASMKTGELFTLRDPDDPKRARFELYGRGLYQDALSMLAEDDGLYVLHRRNLTKIGEHNGIPDRFDRIFALTHGIADTYDMAYGLAREKSGAFVLSYAPYADAAMTGAGSALRMRVGKPPEEIAFGMRNPLGWCSGPEGDVFFTDNQGDWVATNKLCHLDEGKFYGWPNRMQKQHLTKPAGKTSVWVPYGWARSINGVAYDNTGGKFGPFAGQFFMAELMFGGAIVRANVERVNGEYQGACFPFWGKGLLGPLCLSFDPRGKLYVGGITEPGWMAQPDRGAVYRIDFTGKVPFEMQSIHVRPHGFRIVFTAPVDKVRAGAVASYKLESYRYEYTGSYGSPELDRATVKVEKAEVATDGKSVELTTAPLVKDRVYLVSVPGVRAATGEPTVYPTGAYTLNEIPAK